MSEQQFVGTNERAAKIDALFSQSKGTDIPVLLKAKESAKKAVSESPTRDNLAALERASKLLESAMQATKNIQSTKEALTYIEENGRKVGKTKLYEDINIGRLKKQADGTFKQRDIDRYMVSLPMMGTSDAVAERAADRQKRKEEQEIRRIKAIADKEEFNLAVQKGKYIPKEQVHLELAARAMTLSAGLKTAFEAQGLETIYLVEGNPKKILTLVERLENILDEALNEYSREMEFTVQFTLEQDE